MDEAEVKVPTPVAAADRVAWTAPKGGPYTPTPIIVDDLLYVVADNGVLSAYEVETGTLVYQERIAGSGASFSASPVAADGRLYLASEEGTVYVVRAGRTFESLAANEMGEALVAAPVR